MNYLTYTDIPLLVPLSHPHNLHTLTLSNSPPSHTLTLSTRSHSPHSRTLTLYTIPHSHTLHTLRLSTLAHSPPSHTLHTLTVLPTMLGRTFLMSSLSDLLVQLVNCPVVRGDTRVLFQSSSSQVGAYRF